jgi:putative tricarboxylic transport membrane protein
MCFLGVFIGTLIGVLPGIGPAGTIAILLPLSFQMDAASAVILLAGIFYGAQYGGSTTSILVNIPGEASSVVTCLDGYQMARKGRAGPALGIAAFGSCIGGTLSVFGLMLVAPPLAEFAIKFGPPEYFALVMCGFSVLIYLGMGSKLKAVIVALMGVFLALIGQDLITGQGRFTFGTRILYDGFPLVPMIMGLFGVAEVLDNIEQRTKRVILSTTISSILPTWKDWKVSIPAIFRGSILGFFLGLLPGGGATLSAFAAYAVEKKFSKHQEEFGKGRIEGVAAPESANNAATGGAFVPMLVLGIPSSSVMAMIMAALMSHGVQPGPLLLVKSPDVFWGVVVSMYIGNIMLLVLNLPLIGLWVKLLKIPYSVLFPMILLFCIIGAYSTASNYGDVFVMIAFGVVGYLMRKFEYEPIPMIFAFILTPLIERSFRQALIFSHGSLGIFFRPPIAFIFMSLSIILFASMLRPFIKMIVKRSSRGV